MVPSLDKVNVQGDDIAFFTIYRRNNWCAKVDMLTHRNIYPGQCCSMVWVKTALSVWQKTALATLLLYPIFSLTVCCFCFIGLGAKCLLITIFEILKIPLKH